MDVYIKPNKKATVTGRKVVYLKDVAEVFSPSGKQEALQNTIVLEIKNDKRQSHLVSILDILKAVNISVPEANITNLGETDSIVEYSPVAVKDSNWKIIIKVICVSIVLFFGGATAIMSFHSDGQIPNIFDNFYYIFFGERTLTPYILDVPYAIGLAVGIFVFFNHFAKIHITQDPTPIEVQMSTYEKETLDSIIDNLGREKEIKKQK